MTAISWRFRRTFPIWNWTYGYGATDRFMSRKFALTDLKSRMSNEAIKKLMFLIIVSVTIPSEWWLKLQLLLWLCVCNCSASLLGQATIFLELLKTSWAEGLWKYLDSLMLYSRTPVPMRLLKKRSLPNVTLVRSKSHLWHWFHSSAFSQFRKITRHLSAPI